MASDLANVTVDSCAGQLLVDYCRATGIGVIVRGLCSKGDLGHEWPMAQMTSLEVFSPAFRCRPRATNVYTPTLRNMTGRRTTRAHVLTAADLVDEAG
jgi:hypothetical protein